MSPQDETAVKDKIRREIVAKARRRAYSKIGFMWHLAVYVLVNAGLIGINLNFSANTIWYVWPLCGWGVGLLLHAFATYGTSGLTDDMIDKEIEREMRRRGLEN